MTVGAQLVVKELGDCTRESWACVRIPSGQGLYPLLAARCRNRGS